MSAQTRPAQRWAACSACDECPTVRPCTTRAVGAWMVSLFVGCGGLSAMVQPQPGCYARPALDADCPAFSGCTAMAAFDPSARNSSSTSAPLRARVPPGSARRTTLGELRPMTWLVRATSSWFTTRSPGAAVGSIYPARRLGSPRCWRLRTPSGGGKESRQPRTSGLMWRRGYTEDTVAKAAGAEWAKRSAVRC